MIASLGLLLCTGGFIILLGLYLGFGTAGLLAISCLLGAVFGIGMIVRPDGGSRYGAAVWDVVLAALFPFTAVVNLRFFLPAFSLAIVLLAMAGLSKAGQAPAKQKSGSA